jgi:aryl-alcohol dehydrogenase-like predicted oxidoreductase
MGLSRFVAMQIPYSLLDRAVERAILPMAKHWDMAVLPWGLLEAGILTGKFLQRTSDPTRIDPEKLNLSEKALNVVSEVQKISEQVNRPMSQVAVNWVRQQQDKAQMIPILGARRLEQLQDNLAVLEWSLNNEQLNHLDEVSAIELGFPHGFLDGNPYIFGATFDKINNHRA